MKTKLVLLLAFLCGCATTHQHPLVVGERPGERSPSSDRGQHDDRPRQEGAAGDSRADFESVPEFGGDSSVARQLKADDEIVETVFRFDGLQRALAPYFEWKARLNENHGLALGADYTALAFSASEDLGGSGDAGSGNLRLFGSWTPIGSESGNTGSLVFKFESRRGYTDVPVSGLGFETGYVGLLGPPFNDNGSMMTNLYWMQKFNGGKATVLAGFVDATDYLDVYGLINPWTHFSNLVFSTGSGSMPAPNQGLGAVAGAFVGDSLYVVGGIADTNGDPTQVADSVDSFFDDAEYFTHVEVGWVSSHEERYLNNTHLTLWHADERGDALVPGGAGVNFSWAQFLDDSWLPFVRAGHANDGGALLEDTLSVGCGHYMRHNSDLVALGLNWGNPSEDFGVGLRDQYTAELFYRVQLSQNFAITPDVQLVIDPALNPAENTMWFVGLRARLSL
jgi:porin